jgi:hypothetical protein
MIISEQPKIVVGDGTNLCGCGWRGIKREKEGGKGGGREGGERKRQARR